MRHARVALLFPLLLAVLVLGGCNDSQQADNPRGFNLTGRYPIVISGTEGGEPFEAIGHFDLVTDEDNDVTGTWEFFGPPPTVQSGTLSGENIALGPVSAALLIGISSVSGILSL